MSACSKWGRKKETPPERGGERGQDSRGVRGVTEDRELARRGRQRWCAKKGRVSGSPEIEAIPQQGPPNIPTLHPCPHGSSLPPNG